MSNIQTPECLGLELEPRVEECFGPSASMSLLVGKNACGGCVKLCVDQFQGLIQQRNELQNTIDELRNDELTGVLTRRGFAEEFNKFRDQRKSFALIFMDIENFADFNSRYGHRGGDTILKAVGHSLAINLRQGDAVALQEHASDYSGAAGRRGGDEFVMLIDLTPRSDDDPQLPLQVYNRKHTRQFKQRFMNDFEGWFRNSLEEIQEDVPERDKISTNISMHIDYVVSDAGDTRSLEELIHAADPDKRK